MVTQSYLDSKPGLDLLFEMIDTWQPEVTSQIDFEDPRFAPYADYYYSDVLKEGGPPEVNVLQCSHFTNDCTSELHSGESMERTRVDVNYLTHFFGPTTPSPPLPFTTALSPPDQSYVDVNRTEEVCYCYPSCREVFYSVSMSSSLLSRFYAKDHVQFLPKGYNGTNDVLNNLVVLDVLFVNTQELEIEQIVAYGWTNFLGDVGGVLGLFLGASAFSLIEFAFFMCQLWQNYKSPFDAGLHHICKTSRNRLDVLQTYYRRTTDVKKYVPTTSARSRDALQTPCRRPTCYKRNRRSPNVMENAL
eukprot:sb/3467272/